MLKPKRLVNARWIAALAAVALIIEFASPNGAEPPQEVSRRSRIHSEIQGILIAAYAELRSGRLTWSFDVDQEKVTVGVSPAAALLPPISSALPRGRLLTADVTPSPDGRVAQLSVAGTLAGTERLAALRSAVLGGSDAFVRGQLQARGAAFSPSSDPSLKPSLVDDGLARALALHGGIETRFLYGASRPELSLTWEVQSRPARGAATTATINFEPFTGRLVSVLR
jgi:hypothetical protein